VRVWSGAVPTGSTGQEGGGSLVGLSEAVELTTGGGRVRPAARFVVECGIVRLWLGAVPTALAGREGSGSSVGLSETAASGGRVGTIEMSVAVGLVKREVVFAAVLVWPWFLSSVERPVFGCESGLVFEAGFVASLGANKFLYTSGSFECWVINLATPHAIPMIVSRSPLLLQCNGGDEMR
jgi:hypothetical protein